MLSSTRSSATSSQVTLNTSARSSSVSSAAEEMAGLNVNLLKSKPIDGGNLDRKPLRRSSCDMSSTCRHSALLGTLKVSFGVTMHVTKPSVDVDDECDAGGDGRAEEF